MTNTVRKVWDMACPGCGSDAHLSVVVQSWAKLSADGTDADSEHDWDSESGCRCTACGHAGLVSDFTLHEE